MYQVNDSKQCVCVLVMCVCVCAGGVCLQAIAVAVAHQLDETAANVMKCVLSLAQPVNMQTARGKEVNFY